MLYISHRLYEAFFRHREQRSWTRTVGWAEPADGIDGIDVLQALFRHGAATGYPRSDALASIERYEPLARGPFAGVIGVFDADGSVDAACVTRSMWSTPQSTVAQAGAKVVLGSDAEEYRECLLKTAAVRQSLRTTRA